MSETWVSPTGHEIIGTAEKLTGIVRGHFEDGDFVYDQNGTEVDWDTSETVGFYDENFQVWDADQIMPRSVYKKLDKKAGKGQLDKPSWVKTPSCV